MRSPAGASAATAGRSPRETAIDVLRGWFIVSMTIAHLASGSLADLVTHGAVWLDGAIGFVTFSGVVLGMVYRRAFDRTGRVPFGKAWRRARLLYLIQLALVVLALLVRSASSRYDDVAHPADTGGWLGSLWLAATLRLPAANLDILPMYVLFLLAAVPALWLLSTGRWGVLLAVSAAVYALATAFPDAAVPAGVHFSWAGWQLPFVLGLVIGWYWEKVGVAARVRSRAGVLLAATVAGVCLVLAQAFGRFGVLGGTTLDQLMGAAFRKFELGPAHIVFGFSAMALGYALVSALLDARALRPAWLWLSLLGSRSLDAFVIQGLAVILLPALLLYSTSSTSAMVLVVLTLLIQTAWIVARRRGYLPGLRTGTDVPARALARRRVLAKA